MRVKNSSCDFTCPCWLVDLKINTFFVPDERITLQGATGTVGLCDAPKPFAPFQDLFMMPVPLVSPFSTDAQRCCVQSRVIPQ
jgi:hypothetical protein